MNMKHRFRSVLFTVLLFALFSVCVLAQSPYDRAAYHENTVNEPIISDFPEYTTNTVLRIESFFDEIIISEIPEEDRSDQKNSSIAWLNGDSYIVAWQDGRAGFDRIYAQVFDGSGNAQGGNALMVGREDGYDLLEPKVVSDNTGGFFLAWRDEATGKIYAARYDNSLNELVSPFTVNSVPAGNFAGPFDIDVYQNTRFIVVYEDYGTGNDISIRIFNFSGTALADPIEVNDDVGTASHWDPSLTVDNVGNMAVTWSDTRNGDNDIFFQRVNADGSLAGSNLGIVQAAYTDSLQYTPQVAYSARDGYAIAWIDERNGESEIFFQHYKVGVGLVGSNVRISEDDTTDAADYNILLDIDPDSNLVMSWLEWGSSSNKIFAQNFTADFVQDGEPNQVNVEDISLRYGVAMIIDSRSNAGFAWTDQRSDNEDIFLQIIDDTGIRIFAEDKQVNDAISSVIAVDPDIHLIDSTKAVVVFSSNRNDDGDIYLQVVDQFGNLVEANKKINPDGDSQLQNEPSVAVSNTNMLVVWNDTKSVNGVTGPRIFGRFTNINGSPGSIVIIPSDSDNVEIKSSPEAAIFDNAHGLITWIDHRDGTPQIYARYFSPAGTIPYGILNISNPAVDINNDALCIEENNSEFVIAWIDRNHAGGPTAIIQRHDILGNQIGRFSFSSDIPGYDITDIDVDINSSGNIYLFWEGSSSDRNLYLHEFSPAGAVVNSEMVAAGIDVPTYPSIAEDGAQNITLTWIANVDGKRKANYRMYLPDYSIGSDGIVSTFDTEFMTSPVASAWNLNGWFAWVDPRAGGNNIFLRNVDLTPVDIDDDDPELLPSGFALEQNYPNPVNPGTKIEFEIPSRMHVEISIYNVLGKRVSIVTDEAYEAGRHNVAWHGNDDRGNPVASGLYFYRMTAGEFSATRKMLIIK